MKGFEITINDSEVVRAASDNLLNMIMMVGTEGNYMSIGGIDSRSNRLRWPVKGLQLGDKITVRVTDIKNISPLGSSEPTDREDMKNRYYDLKEQLEEKNLI